MLGSSQSARACSSHSRAPAGTSKLQLCFSRQCMIPDPKERFICIIWRFLSELEPKPELPPASSINWLNRHEIAGCDCQLVNEKSDSSKTVHMYVHTYVHSSSPDIILSFQNPSYSTVIAIYTKFNGLEEPPSTYFTPKKGQRSPTWIKMISHFRKFSLRTWERKKKERSFIAIPLK